MMASKMYESHLKFFLLVDHRTRTMPNSLYMIDLPNDLGQQRKVDSEGFEAVSPLLVFPQRKFLIQSEFVNLGADIYFFGGISSGQVVFNSKSYKELRRVVHVLDTNKPELGLRPVASMNACKEKPCVFVADGMIYTLGREIGDKILSKSGSGCFERYIPQVDIWEVLPDPPLLVSELATSDWISRATVVGREVFIGCKGKYLIFNLDTLEWAKVAPASLAECFPYGVLYVDGFLYHLRGGSLWRPGLVWDPDYISDPLQIVRRGPFPKRGGCCSSSKDILECVNLEPKKAQVVSTVAELGAGEGDKTFFTHNNFQPWRELLHLGGPYFCYLVTALNCDFKHRMFDGHTRFVGIVIFKELQGENMNAGFSLVSSFFYRINTNFYNTGEFIRCCAIGAVPESWNNVLPIKKQETNSRTKKNEVLHMAATQQGNHLLVDKAGSKESETVNHDCLGDVDANAGDVANLKKLLAAQEEELNRLFGELAKKDELLKTYEAGLV